MKTQLFKAFYNSLLAKKIPSNHYLSEVLGREKTIPYSPTELYSIGGGSCSLQGEWNILANQLPGYIFLYIKKGSVTVSLYEDSFNSSSPKENFLSVQLFPGNFILLCKNNTYSLTTKEFQLDYELLLFDAPYVTELFSLLKKPLLRSLDLLSIPVNENTPLLFNFRYLISSEPSSLRECLQYTDVLHHTTILYLEEVDNLISPLATIPTYLLDIRNELDLHYDMEFSLDQLEIDFQKSKFRICREFSSCFGISLIQYLNRRRITEAKRLLLTTNLTVHEIGSQVGIDNTNHFINIFKSQTGLTPSVYRKKEHLY